jgi:DNA-directed RNA polymerase subunit L
MAAKVTNLIDENDRMTFTISNIDVSYINSIRRTILSNIEIIGFKTSPYEENKCEILINTSRPRNEIIKQRLSCIPVCIKNIEEFPIDKYILELDVENNTDTVISVTTNDFKIRNIETNKYMEDAEVKKIFPPFIPPNGDGEHYIDFLWLRPKLTDEIPGERIKLTCKFSIVTAKDDSSFNVSGTCSHSCTPDHEKIKEQLEIRKQKWKDEGKTEKEIDFEASNWTKLEGLRYIIKDSFDFIIETVGIYDNDQILIKACIVLLNKLETLKNMLEKDEVNIIQSDNTLDNCYDVILENEDYTIGNILNYELYRTFYTQMNVLNFIGFKKMHPHDTDGILRLSLVDTKEGISTVKTIINKALEDAIKTMFSIKGCFDGSRKVIKKK